MKRRRRGDGIETSAAQGERFQVADHARHAAVAQRSKSCVAGVDIQSGDAKRARQPARHPTVSRAEIEDPFDAGNQAEVGADDQVVKSTRAPGSGVAPGDIPEREPEGELGIGRGLAFGEADAPVIVGELASVNMISFRRSTFDASIVAPS